MKNLRHLTACMALATLLTGCASTGNGTVKHLTQDRAAQAILIGKSTTTDMHAAFGDASITRFSNGYELWLYQLGYAKMIDSVPYVNLFVRSADNKKELSILFDKVGVVKKYQLMDLEPSTATALPDDAK